jgi:glycerol-3-phosphate acyltransferase PlsX
MGAVYARDRFSIVRPKVGLLSIGEEAGKGSPFVKECFDHLSDPVWAANAGCEWIGNVEGRDVMTDEVDVVVTDGFTGNVTLKTLEGAMRALIGRLLVAIDTDDETRAAGTALGPALDQMVSELHPDSVGGALLLGIKGICVISHGSSSPAAIVNAIRVAHEMVEVGMVDHLTSAAVSD